MSAKELKNLADFNSVNFESDWVLVDFWATWCGPCQSMLPVFDKIADSFNSQLSAVKVDVDQLQSFAVSHGVRGVPTLMLFHKGKPVDRLVGAQPEGQVSKWLSGHLA
ncbi:thioredoxin [Pelagibaculum spongiae]|uniref:thioredoxin n=1 Tax=Pelagibaculum spongiae TaxID=2080658 RepID=UPI0013148938|nr:thioredoxin [Pelagibaculum spongiae]